MKEFQSKRFQLNYTCRELVGRFNCEENDIKNVSLLTWIMSSYI